MSVNTQSELVIESQLHSLVQQLTLIYPSYSQRMSDIGLNESQIITNSQLFINLFESQQLVSETRMAVRVTAWRMLLRLVCLLIENVPINAAFLLQKCKFAVVQGGRPINFIGYLCMKSDDFVHLSEEIMKQEVRSSQEESSVETTLTEISALTDTINRLFSLFLNHASVPQSSLHSVAQILIRRYFSARLSALSITNSYNFIRRIAQLHSKPQNSTTNTKSYLYYDGSAHIGLRVLLNPNKWCFAKGMHLSLWLTCLGNNSRTQGKSIILHLKTDDNKQIRILKLKEQLAVQCVSGSQRSYRKVCQFLNKQLMHLEIVLESSESGFFGSFGSVQYQLHIIVNKQVHQNIEIKVPRFTNQSYITDFNLFEDYIGLFHFLSLAKSRMVPPNTIISSQSQLNDYLKNNEDSANLLTILSPMRVHKGIVINHISCDSSHACHEAQQLSSPSLRTSDPSYRADVMLVYMYFCCCVLRSVSQFSIEYLEGKEQRRKVTEIFNVIVSDYLDVTLSRLEDHKVQTHLSNAPKKHVHNLNTNNLEYTYLYILYFLEAVEYPIRQTTLNKLISCSLANGTVGTLTLKYLDLHGVMAAKNLNYEPYRHPHQSSTRQLADFDPVTKLQLLFMLQTNWQKLYNHIIHSNEWWTTHSYLQIDTPFSHEKYVYNSPVEKDVTLLNWQWKVAEFITNDFCDCLLLPQFRVPEPYDQVFHVFRDRYIKRECMGEYFQEQHLVDVVTGLNVNSYVLEYQRVSKSIFVTIKDRISNRKISTQRNSQNDEKQESVLSSQPYSQGYYYAQQVSYINLLTLTLGELRVKKITGAHFHSQNLATVPHVKKQLLIEFFPRHYSKNLNHLCVKAFKHQEFNYIALRSTDIRSVRQRRYNQSINGLEIRIKSGVNYLFYFHMEGIQGFISQLRTQLPSKMFSKDPYDDYLKSGHTLQWIDKQISNYQYLQQLNDISGRSYSDITQYPVLPWLYVYGDSTIDLPTLHSKNEHRDFNGLINSYFRDLTKNMGSMGPKDRIQHFIDKFEAENQGQIFNEYHFGTHYSSSAIIFNYLIRLQPFSTGAITLQSGKFDCADRVFSSYIGSWVNATTSPTDVRQLVPEIYILPEMMININNYNFGVTQLKQTICNVQLPTWANNNPYIFCTVLRKALESSYTSSMIKDWIDLIYGYKQKGKDAVENMNIYFPLTYENAINLNKVEDPEQRISLETQIAHFGQNPAQIIGSSPHPARTSIPLKWQHKLLADCNELLIQKLNLPQLQQQQENFIYQSVFEDKNSVLGIRFMGDHTFLVLRRYSYLLFKLLDQKSGFISKEKEVEYAIETDNISLDYLGIRAMVPIVTVETEIAFVGGFYDGYLQIIDLYNERHSGKIKMPFRTISAMVYCSEYHYMYIGDNDGFLGVYELHKTSKDVLFVEKYYDRVHDDKINYICVKIKANMFVTASQDGSVKLFNLYSQQFYRKIVNPSYCGVSFANICICPLYSVIFYSSDDNKLYSYSINGQYLASREQPTGFIYSLSVQENSQHLEHSIYLNANRQIYIDELPFLKTKKIIRLKKDSYRISCCEIGKQIALAGTQNGGIQIIADPSSF